MSARVENNNRGQNAGGQQSGENPGSALDQLRKTSVSYSLEEQVIRAELLWVLKMVESDFSFKSAENMVRLLCLMDEGNQIFRKMSLGRTKCGYYVTHALFPFYLEALVNRVQKVPAYTLGVDGGSFKVRGLKKMMDIVIRWFSSSQYCLITSSGTGTSQGVRMVRGVRWWMSFWPLMKWDTSLLISK